MSLACDITYKSYCNKHKKMRLPAHSVAQPTLGAWTLQDLNPTTQSEVLMQLGPLAAGSRNRAAIDACCNPSLPVAPVIALVMKQCASSARSQQDLSQGCTVAEAVRVLATDSRAVGLLLQRPEPVLHDGMLYTQPTAMEALLAAAKHAVCHQPVQAEAVPFVCSCMAAIAAVAKAAPEQFVESPPAAANDITWVLGQGLCLANDAAIVRAAARAAACLARCPAAARYLTGVRLLAGLMDVLSVHNEEAAAAAAAALVILAATKPGDCARQPYFLPELLAAVSHGKSDDGSPSAGLLPQLLSVMRSLTHNPSSAHSLAAMPGLTRLLADVLRCRQDDAGIVQAVLMILYVLSRPGCPAGPWVPAVSEVGPLSAVLAAAATAANEAWALGWATNNQHDAQHKQTMLLVGAVADWLLHRAIWPRKRLHREVVRIIKAPCRMGYPLDRSRHPGGVLWACVIMYVWQPAGNRLLP